MNDDPYKELQPNMTSHSNITQTTDSLCVLEVKTYLLVIGYAVVFVVGLTGNGFVLYTFRHYWRRGPIIELIILYLASFNFISSFLDPMTFGYWLVTCYRSWHFGWFGCIIVPSLCRVSTNVSIGLILIMAIDRCRAIVFPFRRRLKRGMVHALVFLAIVIGFLSEIHHMIGSFINDSGLCTVVNVVEPGYLYPLIVSISGRILTITFVLTFTTLTAYFKLKQSFDQKLLCAGGNITNRSLSERCRKVTLMLVVMATVFSVTILPRDFFHIIYAITWGTGTGIKLTEAVKTINQLLKLLQTSNVIYNVFIYARMHSTFRKQRTCLFPGYMVKIFSRRNNMMLTRKRKRRTDESVVETCLNNSEDSV